MDISQLELTAPTPVAETITDELLTRTTVAVYGRAKQLARLSSSPNLRHLWISGVNAATVHVIGSIARLERLVIHDLRVPDLNALAQLQTLTELGVAGSAKLKSLAGIESLLGLSRLVLFDSCNYRDIERLAGLAALETLCLEGGFSRQLSFASLEPLRHLLRVRRLRLASLRVADGSLRPLHALQQLKEVFIANAFVPAEFRALAAALPHVRGEFVDSFRDAG